MKKWREKFKYDRMTNSSKKYDFNAPLQKVVEEKMPTKY